MTELHTFEILAEDSGGTVDRLSVAGGWLYRTRTWDNRSNTFATSLAYVPDAAGGVDGPAPPAIGASCFWYASIVAADLVGAGEWAALAITAEDAYGEIGLIAAADGGFAVTDNCVVALDLWCEFETPPASGAQIGFQINKAGTVLTRGQAQILPGVQTIQRAGYQGLLQPGHLVYPAGLFAAGDQVAVLVPSYITAHIMPS